MQVLKAFKELFASTQCERKCKLSSLRAVRELDEVSVGITDGDGKDGTQSASTDEGHFFYLNEFGF
jgi:hypothetical protein